MGEGLKKRSDRKVRWLSEPLRNGESLLFSKEREGRGIGATNNPACYSLPLRTKGSTAGVGWEEKKIPSLCPGKRGGLDRRRRVRGNVSTQKGGVVQRVTGRLGRFYLFIIVTGGLVLLREKGVWSKGLIIEQGKGARELQERRRNWLSARSGEEGWRGCPQKKKKTLWRGNGVVVDKT